MSNLNSLLTLVLVTAFFTLGKEQQNQSYKHVGDDRKCSLEKIDYSTEQEISFCVEIMSAQNDKRFREYTLYAAKLGHGHAALEVYSNDTFPISVKDKNKYLFQAAYSCYQPAYYLAFKSEAESGDKKEAELWYLLLKMEHNLGAKDLFNQLQVEKPIEQMVYDKLLSFFGRFQCNQV
ncbi:hypothetical protein PSECIP111951_02076 [Pseudoalteromonas holothuriae]|uniref:Sel1 repeat family protein n=1 Tax=Pseudoalteromonas holothuriae TaxID=2963714 RepID=A0ABM9GIA1_9GAMM|nr:hypothetical protein [Pseudoalteromonas sp. CIP111951]CAH9059463.1 hypothetical protein PSECIP111951_02076 [Pseudoalteromonas sp. CIP111951]